MAKNLNSEAILELLDKAEFLKAELNEYAGLHSSLWQAYLASGEVSKYLAETAESLLLAEARARRLSAPPLGS